MVVKTTPELNKVYLIHHCTLFHILKGTGGIQVDFKAYHDWKDKIIFLDKGQYIRFLSDDFVVRKIEFPNEAYFNQKEIRVLFKHLISLGYINFNECIACQKYLTNTAFSAQLSDIIDVSSKQWYWQNPFCASKEEYHIIFDVKDVVDQQYNNHLNNEQLAALITSEGQEAQALFRQKVGISMKGLLKNKRLIESKKALVFTDKSVKEIAYDMGYKDPAYFTRIFKKNTGFNPNQFRKRQDFDQSDLFVQNIYELLQRHHQEEHSLAFYADKMHLSVKALSKRVRTELNISLGQLIRQKIINTAKVLLEEGQAIKAIAHQLGFEEANHFSSFFKLHTKYTPTQYKNQKYNS
ncbi:helix-turn-helix domain-containing protein [Aureispira anguillae]|uniref:AraC family transcriptional regulator n=1 Tax=Aureispira anguillae TaxID=2864201 RepID=A0A915YFL7_9BACT|nr:AraC family transcriptional regulator [Aureispira anguillae]BDS12239.1 AraC family transcriptional regulator [Aureispira anguillae]